MKKIVSLVLLFASFASVVSFGVVFAQEFPPTAILNAAYKGDTEMVKLILATNPDPDIRDNFGATALHEAIFESNLEVIRLLLDNGFDVNAQVPSNGYTPLHYAVWLNKPEAVRLLLSYNADKNIKDKKGFTPLEKATKEGKRDLVIALSRR
jgi:ankyrin repeat protein